MKILAIDPGAAGGLALNVDDHPATAVSMPATEGDLVSLLREWGANPHDTVAVVEEVGGYAGMPQPGSAMFKFGRNFGFALGVLQCLGVRVELVRPQKWQKGLGLGRAADCASKAEWKNKLKARAQQLYPHLKPTLATSDALLLLDYALNHRWASLPPKQVTASVAPSLSESVP
jgi:hypothetical protein